MIVQRTLAEVLGPTHRLPLLDLQPLLILISNRQNRGWQQKVTDLSQGKNSRAGKSSIQ